ncbi:MAG TPA: hypothetical protein VGO00_10315, partial [Kofleriaceae bacterium]|nr:hypothetical protein [Kofleriaceae bacterium]
MRMRSFVTVVLLLASSVVVHAQPGATPAQPLAQPAQPKPSTDDAPVDSYRWQTAAADGVTIALMVGAMKSSTNSDQNSFARIALLNYGLTVPIIHAAHGRPGTALASLALRAALPVASIFAFGRGDDDEGTEILAAFMLGMGAAMIIDTAWFARADEVLARS